MTLDIDREFAQALVDYLKTKPYEEVYHLVTGLLQLRRCPAEGSGEASAPAGAVPPAGALPPGYQKEG